MNRNQNRILLIALLILAALLFTVPVAFAQDQTPAPQDTAVATQEATVVPPVNVNINTGGEASETSGDGIPWETLSAIALLVGGGYGLARIIDGIRSNRKAVAELESRADKFPDLTASAVVKAAEVVESGAKLMKELFDRIPAASKPTDVLDLSTVPTEALRSELAQRANATVAGNASAPRVYTNDPTKPLPPVRFNPGAPADSEDR